MKKTYLARLKRLEYDQKAGLAVPIEQIATAYGAELATVRRRLLAVPSEAAPRLLQARTAPEM